MANLYILPDAWLIALSIWALLSLAAESFLVYYRSPLPSFKKMGRKMVEGAVLLILLMIFDLIHDALDGHSSGVMLLSPHRELRTVLVLVTAALFFYGGKEDKRNYILSAASFLLLPLLDQALPWSLMLLLLICNVRTAIRICQSYRQYHEGITAHAIEEAINKMPEGIFLTREDGVPVLVNDAMKKYMEDILGKTVSNGSFFRKEIEEKGETLKEGKEIIHALSDGRIIRFTREPFMTPTGFGWQMGAFDMTDMVRMNRELEEKNEALRKQNEKMKDLLEILVPLESREALRTIRFKIHDMMGQRISCLQQILNNKDYKNYGSIGRMLSRLLEDMEKEIKVKPDLILTELLGTYESLGIRFHIKGKLPEGAKGSLFVEILREAAVNAIIHGKADEITVTFEEENHYAMTVTDNGTGSSGPLKEGGGLSSIRTRVEKEKGTMAYTTGCPFILKVTIPEKDSLSS